MQNLKSDSGSSQLFEALTAIVFTGPKFLVTQLFKLLDWVWIWQGERVFWAVVLFLTALDLVLLKGVFIFRSEVIDYIFTFPDFPTRLVLIGAYAYLAVTLFFLHFFLLPEAAVRITGGIPISENDQMTLKFRDSDFLENRNAPGKDRVFLGMSRKTRKPIFLTDDMRLMHTQVVGSTGSGKTESVLLPLMAQDLKRGRGFVFIDAKGDKTTLAKFVGLVKTAGREKDLRVFSLAYPRKSFSYNPLKHGGYTEIKDRLMGGSLWSEEYYKKRTADILQTVLWGLCEHGETVTFSKLRRLFDDPSQLESLAATACPELKEALLQIKDDFKAVRRDLTGFVADLGEITGSEFRFLLRDENGELDLRDAYQNHRIIYFQLNTQGYQEIARRLGRIILQDLKCLSNFIQSELSESERQFFPIFVDEFSNFAYPDFIELLNKARASGMAITIAHQSLGDLLKQGPDFLQQILENTNIKIALRQDAPTSIDTLCRIAGTRKIHKETTLVEENLLGKTPSGLGSLREVDEFILEPNFIRTLKRGEAALIVKAPSAFTHFVKLDYLKDIALAELPDRNFKEKVTEVESKTDNALPSNYF